MQYNEDYSKIFREYTREDILCNLYPVMLPIKTAMPFMVKTYETGIEDVEIIYFVKTCEEPFPVTRHVCEHYSIEPIELERSANDIPYTICMKHISKIHGIKEDVLDMYAMTNGDSIYGAGLLVTDTGRQTICQFFQHDPVYIFPASVHEVIIIPARCLETERNRLHFKEHLKGLAIALADTDKELVLSEHVYRFTPECMTFRTVL